MAEAERDRSHLRRETLSAYPVSELQRKQRGHDIGLVGRRIKVWWDGDQKWFAGRVQEFIATVGEFTVCYDDGDQRSEALNDPTLQWEFVGDGGESSSERRSKVQRTAAGVADKPMPAGWRKVKIQTKTTWYYDYIGPGGQKTQSYAKMMEMVGDDWEEQKPPPPPPPPPSAPLPPPPPQQPAASAAAKRPSQPKRPLPPGWTVEVHHYTTDPNKTYKSYHGPNGEKAYSISKAHEAAYGKDPSLLPAAVIPPEASDPKTNRPQPVYTNRAAGQGSSSNGTVACKTFWQAGDYSSSGRAADDDDFHRAAAAADGLDRPTTHPKFLHSNATSHKWALGALAELLDNSYDEMVKEGKRVSSVRIHIDVMQSWHTESEKKLPVLCVRDDGGGMDRAAMHRMMSFGVSGDNQNQKRIGRYGNGFKSSSIRIGGDALVLSVDKTSGNFTAGLLSYTFLRNEKLEDILVPLIEWDGNGRPLAGDDHGFAAEQRLSALDILLKWGPGLSESQLLNELRKIGPHGTKILIYNLWEGDHGELELDLFTDLNDVRTRPGRIDEEGPNKKKQSNGRGATDPAAKEKYFAWEHSLRSYASILYREHPKDFAMFLRGKKVEPRDIRKDLKIKNIEKYAPSSLNGLGIGGKPRSYRIDIGFAKEAPKVDAQGFNLYHNNRLIKPMWQVYKSPSSVGRGVIGVLDVDFVQPSHDKQDFERTDAMRCLEAKLKLLTVQYWKTHGRKVGYQGANPLPSEKREKAAEASAAMIGELDDEDEDLYDPEERRAAGGGAVHTLHGRPFGHESALFGEEREGGRKRKLPTHMQEYTVYHKGSNKEQQPARREHSAGGGGGNGAGSSSADAPPGVQVVQAVAVTDGDEEADGEVVAEVVHEPEEAAGVEGFDGLPDALEVEGAVEAAVEEEPLQVVAEIDVEAEKEVAAALALRERREKLEALHEEHAELSKEILERQKRRKQVEALIISAQHALARVEEEQQPAEEEEEGPARLADDDDDDVVEMRPIGGPVEAVGNAPWPAEADGVAGAPVEAAGRATWPAETDEMGLFDAMAKHLAKDAAMPDAPAPPPPQHDEPELALFVSGKSATGFKYVSKVISKGVTKFSAAYFDHDLHHGNGGTVNLGAFETAKEAAVAYARYAAKKGVYAVPAVD